MYSRRVAAIALASACGGGSATPDASTASDGVLETADGNAPADADLADAYDPTVVDVKVYARTDEGLPDATATVVFSDPSGTEIATTTTNAQGRAFASMPLGGRVTVLQAQTDPDNPYHRYVLISEIRSVEAGDDLVFGRPRSIPDRAGATTVMNVDDQFGGGIVTMCGTRTVGTGSDQLVFGANCVAPTFDLLVFRQEATERLYVMQEDVPYSAGGTVTIPNTPQAMPNIALTLLGTPSNQARVFATSFALLDGFSYESGFDSIELPSEGTNNLEVPYYPTTAPTLIIAGPVAPGFPPDGRDYHTVVTTTPASVSIDLAADLPLPALSGVTQSATGLTWTQTGATTGDARLGGWAAEWTDGNGVVRHASVSVIEPVSSITAMELPSLPSALAEDDPNGKTLTLEGGVVEYLELDNLNGYSAARVHGPRLGLIEAYYLDVPHRGHIVIKSAD